MKDGAIGFGIGMIFILALYFFYHIPEVNKSFNKGKSECDKETEVIYLPGKPIEIIKGNKITDKKETPAIEENEIKKLTYDNEFVSNKDTIGLYVEVNIRDNIPEWLININHKDVETIVTDTVKTFYPKYIYEVQKETNWLLTLIAYILGIATGALLLI